MTRVIYNYPEDAQQGDTFVVEEITVSPTTVEIHLERFVPPVDERAMQDRETLQIADSIVERIAAKRGTTDPSLYLLVQAYRAARPIRCTR